MIKKENRDKANGKKDSNLLFISIFYLFFLFSISFISGELAYDSTSSLGTFKQNNDIQLKQICTYGGSDCDNCNISSVTYSAESINLVEDVSMVKDGFEYIYNLSSGNNTRIGTYKVNGFCQLSTNSTPFVYEYEISQTGLENESTYFLILLGVAIIVGIIMYILSYIFDKKMFIFSSIGFVISGIGVLYFPYLGESQFVNNGISILLNGIGLLIIGVHIIPDWFE
jgi:hypothetical protein